MEYLLYPCDTPHKEPCPVRAGRFHRSQFRFDPHTVGRENCCIKTAIHRADGLISRFSHPQFFPRIWIVTKHSNVLLRDLITDHSLVVCRYVSAEYDATTLWRQEASQGMRELTLIRLGEKLQRKASVVCERNRGWRETDMEERSSPYY